MTHDDEMAALLSLVGHDLRSPLTALLLGSRLVSREKGLSEPARQVAAEMEDAAEDLQRRILDWLDLSRSKHAALQLQPASIDLGDVAQGAFRDAQRKARLRGQTVQLDARSVVVKGDARILPRCLLAMLDHAMQHAPAGGSIVLSVHEADGGGSVCVKDSGPPMTAPEKAFEVMPDRSDGRAMGGIGLALAAVMAQGLGGRVWAENGTEGGSLHLWLPGAT